MAYKLNQNQTPHSELNQKQTQRMMATREMSQALHVLMSPVMELRQLIELELEENPLLEYSLEDKNKEEGEEVENPELAELNFDNDNFEALNQIDDAYENFLNEPNPDLEKKRNFLESLIVDEETLIDHLMKQAREAFDDPELIKACEYIAGNLDDTGLLTISPEEISTLNHIPLEIVKKALSAVQTFDPPGIAAKDIRDCLLIQLNQMGKINSLAYKIIDKYFNELLHHKLNLIQKGLKIPIAQIQQIIDKEIALLNLHPATSSKTTPFIQPDIFVKRIDDTLEVIINNEVLPSLKVNMKAINLLKKEGGLESKNFLLNKMARAKWFMKTISQRGKTLEGIVKSLIKRDREYFISPEGVLKPLTMKTLADELKVHESTIARAVSNKYVDCPRGIIPLRQFFSSSFATSGIDTLSSRSIKDLILQLISKEDKKNPLSDEEMAVIIKAKGIICARRTIAKFRVQLKIGNAHQRRKY